MWSGIGEDSLDHNIPFTVDYSENKDQKLSPHVDDSEITVNYCLTVSDDIKGNKLSFKGVKCRQHLATSSKEKDFSEIEIEASEVHEYENVAGRAVMHLGHHLH